jgi:DNA-binding response OmpR family regulator
VGNFFQTRPKIIYAEDQDSIARLVEFTLAKEGFDVTVLQNGERVVEMVLELKPDLILLDIMLPIKNGLTILEELKSNEEVRNIPVIMLSIQGEEKKILQAFNAGAVDYIQKPFSTTELATRIRKALA